MPSRGVYVKTPEYFAWSNMIQRCTNPKHPSYRNYGARGISVCKSWLTFLNFLREMGMRPSSKHTLERKNNGLGYNKQNCEWTTRKQQARNKRDNRLVTFSGKTQCVMDWAIQVGVAWNTMAKRLRKWDLEKALTTPVRGRHDERRNSRMIQHADKKQCLEAWARDTGIHHVTILNRLRRGWAVKEALTTKPATKHRNKKVLSAL